MKRLINVRIPLIISVALITGIILGYLFIYYGVSLFWITAVVPATAVIVILLCLFSEKRIKTVITVTAALVLVSGTLISFTYMSDYRSSRLTDGVDYNVYATVCEKGETSYGEYIILKNVSANGEKIGGKIIVYLGETYGDFCDVGYKVNFKSTVSKNDLFAYGKLNYYAPQNVKYRCNVNGGLTAKYGYSFFGNMRSRIRDTLYENLDKDTAAVAFAMLTGDTQGIEDGTLDSLRYGGIAHIFAVSGLHIGILYGLLYFIFKKLNFNKYALAVCCIIPLIFYAGVCGFTLSSVRAVIMCSVSSIAKSVHKKYDGLNALSLSVIIILIINPLNLFSVGFQLSISATLGIILLSKSIVRPLGKLPRKVAGTVSVCLAAQAGTMPVMLANFGYLSVAGILLNILVLPLLSVAYILIFVSCTAAALIPFAAVILPYFTLPLQLFVSAFVNAGFENALISGFGAGAFLPVYYLGLFALSDKINLKLIQRITAFVSALIFLCIYVPLRILAPFKGYQIAVSAYYGGGEVLIKSHEGNVLVITENISPSQTPNFLNEYYANGLSAVIILGGDGCVMSYGDFNLNCKNVYVYYGFINVQPYSDCTVYYESEFSVGGINFSFADGYSLFADCGGASVAICAGDYVPFENCDLLISDVSKHNCNCAFTVGFNERNIEYNVYNKGNFVFNVRDGKFK